MHALISWNWGVACVPEGFVEGWRKLWEIECKEWILKLEGSSLRLKVHNHLEIIKNVFGSKKYVACC